jgi:hypothetical protein
MNEVETISLKDFKSWLQGVEDMQETGWTPSPIQWQKIRDKINLIEEVVVNPIPTNYTHRNVVAGPSIPQSQFDESPIIPRPSQSPKVSTYIAPPATPPHFDTPKTPDIDTSNGNYRSTFI